MHTLASTKPGVPSLALQKLDVIARACLSSQHSGDGVRRFRGVILSYITRWRLAWDNQETLPGETEEGVGREKERKGRRESKEKTEFLLFVRLFYVKNSCLREVHFSVGHGNRERITNGK